MPIPYAERRRRRKRLSEELPPGLRERIALRNVEAVAKLSLDSQKILAEALEIGVKIPAAIRYLRENPAAKVGEVVQVCRKAKDKHENNAVSGGEILPDLHDPSAGSGEVIAETADVLQYCFPDMPRMTAEAMARAELLSEVLNLMHAQRSCFEMHHLESDFVLVVLCGLVQKTTDRLNKIIHTKPVYKQALRQSGVDWPGID